MSSRLQASRDSSGEPGSTRRDGLVLLQAIVLLLMNAAMTFAGLAIGTTTSKVTLGQAVDYCIDGRNFRKAATPDLWTLSGSVVAVSSWQKFLLLLDSAGAASIVACTPSTVSADAVVIPDLFVALNNKSLIGVLTIATNGSTTFTPGTTALNAAGITATYNDGVDANMLKLLADESGVAYKS